MRLSKRVWLLLLIILIMPFEMSPYLYSSPSFLGMIPAFTVIKEFDAYDERTRHTNADFPERMSVDELKQSAIVLATFAWHSAMRNERIPRAAKTSRAQ